MARVVHRKISASLQQLLLKPQKFSIHQALRIIEKDWLKNRIDTTDSGLSLLPSSELSFPVSDIRHSYIDRYGNISLELNFMGLYGVDSPLPLYFSQLAAQDTDAARRLRKLLSIINHKIYLYHYLAWRQQHYFIRSEQGEKNYSQFLADLINIKNNEANLLVLNYVGMFLWQKRSAINLASMLRNYFQGIEVAVRKFILSEIKMTETSGLGCRLFLHKNSFLGGKVQKIDRAVLVTIGPINWQIAKYYFLDNLRRECFYKLLALFLPKRIKALVQLKFSLEKMHRAILGSQAMLLNWHTVLGEVAQDFYLVNISERSLSL